MSAPLNYFLHSHGPSAHPTMVLGWVFAGITFAVCVVVGVLLLIAILRKRPQANAQDIGRGGHGLRWIVIGTGVSTIVLFTMAIYALVVLNQSATPIENPALTIKVTGYDWWWKAEYDSFETANEIHIPVGVPVVILLASADVIHAFWVPQLAGKTEMIPGQTNRQWIQADKPGIYYGKCTQFCGLQHAHMDFEVVAESQQDFDAWQAAQRQPAAKSAQPGQRIFMSQCAGCHAVKGTATGGHAPDLTHLGSRRLIAAGLLTNTPGHVADWVAHSQELKPGSRMPDFALPADQASALSAYLSTLK